ncbi:substrate-binding periplasmic protein [Inhella gelatinilytica]|uniref:Amino acid ABC transporter substrate-binding protein n=1 Tax=Inhella gelatinilytica TaxID=2795030 RepID=A0A931NEB9_9BURK|nr:transporter substrate-binding domain-containing protein [Inhella gelatinilytica]MBH9552351.1 amino acid ABC transporter substrate-binding protein [Inhella gelatinilytica]
MRFAEEGNWPPFTRERGGLAQTGLSLALIREIGRRAGFAARLELFPMKRLLLELQQGRHDGVTVISRNPEREALLAFSEPLFQKLGYVYFRAGETLAWVQFADFKGLRLGVTRGHNLGEALDRAIQADRLSVDVGGSDEQNFIKLIAGRVDAVFANHWSALFLLRQDRFKGLIDRAPKPFFTKDYHVGISRRSSHAMAWLPAINKAIQSMKSDGSLDTLLVEHLNPAASPTKTP